MATIYIDNQPFTVDPKDNLLKACLSLGFNLPYFCWHPALGSVGACRQCAVKQFRDETDAQGRLVMACMTPATGDTRISIEDKEAKAFRASVIEWLMLNHPHDCPVCEEGGECHLQDMTVMTGHTYRRTRFKKRTFRNQYLGPFLNHEMNRCIACYRCVRFYQDYAGGSDLQVFATHNHVYFGRQEDGVLENEFSGNLAEVCPTGVFTDKPFSHYYTRKWDLQAAPSLCVHCSLGCNTTPNERYGRLRRILNRYNGQVNGYFLCDRGRFGYDFVNSEQRLRQPQLRLRRSAPAEPTAKEQILEHLAPLLADPSKLLGIGSPRASIEANFALRDLVGPERFHLGLSPGEAPLLAAAADILRQGSTRIPSLADVGQADAVLVLGEDLTHTAPRLALSLRQAARQPSLALADKLNIPRWQEASIQIAAQDQKGALFLATPLATALDGLAVQTYHGAPEEIARLGFAIAHHLASQTSPVVDCLCAAQQSFVAASVQALKAAQRPLIIAGTHSHSLPVLQAAANVAWAISTPQRPADLYLTLPECNSLGLQLMGGGTLEAACTAVADGSAEIVIVLENDLYRRMEAAAVNTLLQQAKQVIVLDHLEQATAAKADILLPAATFAETDGTLISSEGRAQRFFQVFIPEEAPIQPSWRWLQEVMAAAKRPPAWRTFDELTQTCAQALPIFQALPAAAPPASYRAVGRKIPRAPHRYSGRTAMHAHRRVHEPKPPADPNSPLAFSMEGYPGKPPPALIPYFWAPGWNSIQAVNKFQDEVGGSLQGGDPGVRLWEPDSAAKVRYFEDIPPTFERRSQQWLVIPLYHVFGSEELSARAPVIGERMPRPYLALHPDDAARLKIVAGSEVALCLGERTYRLPVQQQASLRLGMAGIPWGLGELTGLPPLPTWGQITLEGEER